MSLCALAINNLMHYCLTCAGNTVHALPATVTELPAKSLILRCIQRPRMPGEWWMSKGNDIQKKKKKDVWADERMEESMMDDTLFRESVRGSVIGLTSL